MTTTVELEDARYARDRRSEKRRTNSGQRATPWEQIVDELVAMGRPKYSTLDLQDAVSRIPIEDHPDAPKSAAEMSALEAGWRKGWAEEFPGEAWPGLDEARKRIRAKNLPPRKGD